MADRLHVSVIVGLVDRLSAPLRGLARDVERVTKMTAYMSFVGDALSRTGRSVLAPLQDATRAAMDFESAMADVRKVVDFPTSDGPAQLARDLERLSRSIPLTAEALAQIAAAGGQSGVAGDALLHYVEVVAKASTAFDMLPQAAGDSFAKLANVYSVAISDIDRVGDAINALSNSMAAKASEIVDTTLRVGGVGRQFGLTAQQVAALSAALISLGKAPEVAATGINALLTKLKTATRQGKQFKGALQSLGVSASDLERSIGQDAQGALLRFLETLERVSEDARAGLLTDLVGLEYGDDLAALVGGLDQYRQALALVSEESRYAGSMQREFEARSATTANALVLLDNRVQELKRALGSLLLPVITAAADRIGTLVTAIRTWADAHPALARALTIGAATIGVFAAAGGTVVIAVAGMTGGLALLSAALTPVGRLLGLLLVPLRALPAAGAAAIASTRGMAMALMLTQGSLSRVLLVLRAISALLLANPLGVAIVGIATAALLIYRYWRPIQAFFAGLWEGVRESLTPLLPVFEEVFGGAARLLRPVIDALRSVWDWLGDLLTPVEDVGGAAHEMGRRWGKAIGQMISRVTELVRVVSDMARQMIAIGRAIVDGLWQGLRDRWDALTSWLRERMSGLGTAAAGVLGIRSPSRAFAELGRQIPAGLAAGVAAAWGAPLAAVRGLAGALGAVPMPAPALAPAGGGWSGSGGRSGAGAAPITIHLTINAPPGTDAHGLASMAGRELTAAAGRLAALYDRSDWR